MNHNPVVNKKVTFEPRHPLEWFWFNDVVENGKQLENGKVYTISKVKTFSSWTSVQLKETGELEYNSMWFKYE